MVIVQRQLGRLCQEGQDGLFSMFSLKCSIKSDLPNCCVHKKVSPGDVKSPDSMECFIAHQPHACILLLAACERF